MVMATARRRRRRQRQGDHSNNESGSDPGSDRSDGGTDRATANGQRTSRCRYGSSSRKPSAWHAATSARPLPPEKWRSERRASARVSASIAGRAATSSLRAASPALPRLCRVAAAARDSCAGVPPVSAGSGKGLGARSARRCCERSAYRRAAPNARRKVALGENRRGCPGRARARASLRHSAMRSPGRCASATSIHESSASSAPPTLGAKSAGAARSTSRGARCERHVACSARGSSASGHANRGDRRQERARSSGEIMGAGRFMSLRRL